MSRIQNVFQDLKHTHKKALINFVMAGDPSREIFREILKGLPQAGADLIEIGMPFTDPMADGATIQAAGLRALAAGQTLEKTLEDVAYFREFDNKTPIILMGYYNPIYIYGVDDFLKCAKHVGVDGLIIVDLPPEEDSELLQPAQEQGIDFIRLVTPTTDTARLQKLVHHASGFLYYVSVNGVTGGKSASDADILTAMHAIHAHSDLPVAVGFGIKTPDDVARNSTLGADAIVVGSAIVDKVKSLTSVADVPELLDFIRALKQPIL